MTIKQLQANLLAQYKSYLEDCKLVDELDVKLKRRAEMNKEMCETEAGGIKASELIEELKKMIAKHGDLPMYVCADGCETAWQIDYHEAGESRPKRFPNDKLRPAMFLIQ